MLKIYEEIDADPGDHKYEFNFSDEDALKNSELESIYDLFKTFKNSNEFEILSEF